MNSVRGDTVWIAGIGQRQKTVLKGHENKRFFCKGFYAGVDSFSD